ncbi:MAG: hypothetical protein PHD48_01945 [Alphaproteobacteria bacterium]|nr:hypothetical protein [Alphaproteobacteria bacterium]
MIVCFVSILFIVLGGFYFQKSLQEVMDPEGCHEFLVLMTLGGLNALIAFLSSPFISRDTPVLWNRPWKYYAMCFLVSVLGALVYWFFHPDRTSSRFGGDDLFWLQVACDLGVLFASQAFFLFFLWVMNKGFMMMTR